MSNMTPEADWESQGTIGKSANDRQVWLESDISFVTSSILMNDNH